MKKSSLIVFIAVLLGVCSLVLYTNLISNATIPPPPQKPAPPLKMYYPTKEFRPYANKGTTSVPALHEALMRHASNYSVRDLQRKIRLAGLSLKEHPASRPSTSTQQLAIQSKRNQKLIQKKTTQLRNIEKQLAHMKKILQKIVRKRNKRTIRQSRRRYRIVTICKRVSKNKRVCFKKRVYFRRR